MVDASERLQVLLSQEANIYRTSDYLTRMQLQAKMEVGGESTNDSPSKKRKSIDGDVIEQPSSSGASDGDGTSSTTINKHWREKICEWAYQGMSFKQEGSQTDSSCQFLSDCHFFTTQQSSIISILRVKSSALP